MSSVVLYSFLAWNRHLPAFIVRIPFSHLLSIIIIYNLYFIDVFVMHIQVDNHPVVIL